MWSIGMLENCPELMVSSFKLALIFTFGYYVYKGIGILGTGLIVGCLLAVFIIDMTILGPRRREVEGKAKAIREAKAAEEKIVKARLQRNYLRRKAQEYRVPLAKKRTLLIEKDDYGDTDDSKWKSEIASFFNNKIGSFPEEMRVYGKEKELSDSEVEKIIDDVAKSWQPETEKRQPFSDDMDGIDYEHYCADLLRDLGWSTTVSQASNDQGVDIIAERNGKTVAIQCKKYSKPVGNKAVQEIAAGKLHYGAGYSAVVTNSTYTNSAKQLAKSAKVLLLHHTDLEDLEQKIQCC